MGDGTEEQNLGERGNPAARIKKKEVLAAFGKKRMIAAWETSTTQAPQGGHLAQNDTSRKLYVQALDSTSGATQGAPYNIAGVVGSRYQDFRTYPDGSVAYAAPGSASTKIKIIRVTPCK